MRTLEGPVIKRVIKGVIKGIIKLSIKEKHVVTSFVENIKNKEMI